MNKITKFERTSLKLCYIRFTNVEAKQSFKTSFIKGFRNN